MDDCCSKQDLHRFDTAGPSDGSHVCLSCGRYTFVWNGQSRSFSGRQWAAVLDKVAEPEEAISITEDRLVEIVTAFELERRGVGAPPKAIATHDKTKA